MLAPSFFSILNCPPFFAVTNLFSFRVVETQENGACQQSIILRAQSFVYHLFLIYLLATIDESENLAFTTFIYPWASVYKKRQLLKNI
jgi:hypothetical protein